jgi:purine-nucleoside phosphorylase
MTFDDVQSVAHHLLRRTKIRPEVGIICGSGLGELAEDLDKDNDADVFETL